MDLRVGPHGWHLFVINRFIYFEMPQGQRQKPKISNKQYYDIVAQHTCTVYYFYVIQFYTVF